MTLDEQARLMTEGTNTSISEGKRAFEAVGEFLAHYVANGDEVRLPGMGTFVKAPTKARTARNPQTGEEITISARRVLTFKPSQVLKDALNGGTRGPAQQ